MQIFVVGLDGEILAVEVSGAEATVDELQQQVELVEGVPPELQRLAFQGAQLQRGRSLQHYGVIHHSTLHLTMDLDGGRGYIDRRSRVLATWHRVNKNICRKCYGRLSHAATRCCKAKCGRTTDIRPKKPVYREKIDYSFFHAKFNSPGYKREVNKYG